MEDKSKQTNFLSISKASRTRVIASTGLFAALSILLTTLSQSMGLNFPIIPYLQFDLGEVAILLAFFTFGPLPAVAASVVEFLTLMVIGQNIPYGPLLKILAILSSIGGLWLGMTLAKRATQHAKIRASVAFGLGFGLVLRVVVLTIANYWLIVYLYSINGIVGFVAAPFRLIGMTISTTNALGLILTFTALFNCLQLAGVFAISYFIVRLPQFRHSLRSNKLAWFESFAERNEARK